MSVFLKNNIAIIPARGGSKRIHKKNIKDFLGIPIIAYSIKAAIESQLFDEVMVSTDDEDIAKIALKYGANVPFLRSAKNSDDYATTYSVLAEVINNFTLDGKSFDNLCCIYPCAPFVDAQKLTLGFQKLEEENFDSVLPIVPFSFPIQRSFIVSEGKLKYKYPEYEKYRSQDLEKTFHDAGQFYWCQVEKMLTNESLMSYNSGYIKLNELEVQDIDNETDWQIAEMKYKLFKI